VVRKSMSLKYEPFKAHRLVYHSTLGLRVIQKKKKKKVSTCRHLVGAPQATHVARSEMQ